MSSKVKKRNRELINESQVVKRERQNVMRALSAIVRKNKGPITLSFLEASAVEESDRIQIHFNAETGEYTISLVEKENVQQRMGSVSEKPGVSGREGDVGGTVPEEQPVSTGGDVRQGDQHDPSEGGQSGD